MHRPGGQCTLPCVAATAAWGQFRNRCSRQRLRPRGRRIAGGFLRAFGPRLDPRWHRAAARQSRCLRRRHIPARSRRRPASAQCQGTAEALRSCVACSSAANCRARLKRSVRSIKVILVSRHEARTLHYNARVGLVSANEWPADNSPHRCRSRCYAVLVAPFVDAELGPDGHVVGDFQGFVGGEIELADHVEHAGLAGEFAGRRADERGCCRRFCCRGCWSARRR